MKAIRVHQHGGPDVLKLEDQVSIPQAGPNQVLVKVLATGVNPVETYLRAGTNNYTVKFPWTPGHDGSGSVEQVGENVKHLKVGDSVYISGSESGTYAQFSLCDASKVNKLPPHVTPEQGACLWTPYATAYHALFQRANLRPRETILVHGASGGVGIAALQFARAHGATVIGTAGTEEGLKLLLQQGAHHAFNHKTEGYIEAIKKVTEGRGVDVVAEMLANVNLDKDLKLLAEGGRVAIIGNRGRIEIDPRDLMARRAQVLGVQLGKAKPDEREDIISAIYAGLEKGTIDPIVYKQLPLSQASVAHEEIINPAKGATGKIILKPWEDK
jgi:NADPH2:quinone reductase